MLSITAHLDKRQIKTFSLSSVTHCNLMAPRLWGHCTLDWTEFEPMKSIDAMFSALIRNAQHVHTLLLRCGWAWTSERRKEFEQALSNFGSLSELRLELPKYASQVSPTMGGEYQPLFRMLAQAGGHLRLFRLRVVHLAKPNSPILQFLATQSQLRSLEGLNFNPRRPVSLPSTTLPTLEKIVATSTSDLGVLVPNRPITSVTLLDLPSDPKFSWIQTLLQSTVPISVLILPIKSLHSAADEESILRVLAPLAGGLKELRLQGCKLGTTSQHDMLPFTSLEVFEFGALGNGRMALPAVREWLNGLGPSLQDVELTGDLERVGRMVRTSDGLALGLL